MNLQPAREQMPLSAAIHEADTDQKFFEEPLVNIIPFACNACPPKQIRITDSCQLHLPPLHECVPQGRHLSG